MIRTFRSFSIQNINEVKQQMLNWATRFNICCFMDNHHYKSPHNSFEGLLAAGCISSFPNNIQPTLSINQFYTQTDDWIFGHFNYEYGAPAKQNTESLITFPVVNLFVPEIIIQVNKQELSIGVTDASHESVLKEILNTDLGALKNIPKVSFSSALSKSHYVEIINALIAHINKGECYEINLCQEFFATNISIDPFVLYQALATLSPNPFSAFYKLNNDYLICASPERFLKKTGNYLLSQPIKGTSPRNLLDQQIDTQNKRDLETSQKDKIENVMVVDLVRNDLSRICVPGSVRVDELFSVYVFPQVYQMISTIVGELKSGVKFSEILDATFPMGSMTGAPKIKVMDLVNKYETQNRGIYSGTLGYITPEKNFDFNVVIRSLVYNNQNKYLSYHVGSGITTNSTAEQEYEECLIKAAAITKIFS